MDIQKLVDALGEAGRMERSHYHLTLGDAITRLSQLAAEGPIKFDWNHRAPGEAHSYRGYYSDLAFDDCDKATVGDWLNECRGALGKTFEGYKGGDFLMAENTPLWSAQYGCTGRAIMGLTQVDNWTIILTKEIP